MKSHEVDYQIVGQDIQLVEVELDPEETVIAEAGAMLWMQQDIEFETRMGDGSAADQGVFSKLWGAGKRMLTGESLFMTHFSNRGGVRRKVAFAAPYPGSIIPVDLNTVGGELICQKDAFLVAALGTQLDIAFNMRFGAGFFGGEGFILQRLRGDGLAFLHAGGTVQRIELNNEELRLDTGCLVGFSPGIDYDIALNKGLKSMFFGGEGLVLATLQGTGSVWVQSLPFARLSERVLAHQSKSKGEGD